MPVGADFEASDRRLRRSLSFQSLFFLSMGAIIGSGWLFAALGADAAAGPAVIIGWIVGGVLVLFIALTYAEVAGMLPRSGAIVRYPHLTHGGYTGFILGWAYLLSAVTVPAIEAEAVIQYAGAGYLKHVKLLEPSGVLSPLGILFAIILMAIFFALNFFGVKLLSRVNNVITWWKLLLPTATFLLLFALDFHAKNFSAYGGFAPEGLKPVFSAIPDAGIVFSYLGFRQALDYGGEARNPQRDIPRATILSVVVGLILYTLLQVGFTGGIVWSRSGVHAGDWAALSSSIFAAAPFYKLYHAAGVAFLGFFASLLLADAVISPFGTGYIYLGTSARTVFGLGVDGYLPEPFHRVNKVVKVPVIALVAGTLLGIVFFAPFPGWYKLVGFISSATVLTYISGGIALQIFRRTAATLSRPFRLPAAAVLAPLGFLSAIMIVYWSGFVTLIDVIAAVFVALPLFTWFFAYQKGWVHGPAASILGAAFLVAWVVTQYLGQWIPAASAKSVHLDFPLYYALMAIEVCAFTAILWAISSAEGRYAVNRSWWLIFLLLAMLLLSYYGGFGPLKKPPIPFPLDTFPALGIGVLAYYLGVLSGYRTEEIGAIVDSGSGLVPDEGAEQAVPAPTAGS